jgi:signal transduction histidine kinase/ActR/RegA family two-component response regulator
MKRVPIRHRLFVVVAAAVVPLAIMSGFALYAGYEQQREQAQNSGLDVARALSIAVDAELRRTVSVLQVLDDALELESESLPAFQERARRVQQSQPFWRAIVLYDVNGKALLSTEDAYGAPVGAPLDRESFDRVIETGKPAIGYLTKRPDGMYTFPVREPVMRGGRLRYVLTAMIQPEGILNVLRSQRVPEDWVVAVADAKGIRVARTRSPEQSVGTPYSSTLTDLMRKAPDEGKGVTVSSDGDSVFTAYTRARDTGWYTAVGRSTNLVESAARHSFSTLGGGIVLSLVVGALFALLLARRVITPMAKLRDSAVASKTGEKFEAPLTDIREIHDVAAALKDASETRTQALDREKSAREAAESANRAKDEFLAMLGHELRNPLSAISNASALLDSPGLPQESASKARGVISRQIRHLTRLTDDLLDVGRALMGKIQLRRKPVDLAQLVAQSLATLKSTQRLRDHRVIEEYQPAWVDCDPIRMDQIVANLVVNAVKYTPAGGTVRVVVGREGHQAVLRVSDDGIGLAPELAARVFDLFVQGERDLDRSQGGLGIGLTLVKRLAEMHGGAASVRSDGHGKGSEFTVRFPAIEQPASSDETATTRTVKEPARHVLIVEDNVDACETLRALLEIHGHRVDTAHEGVGGLERALALQPEVVLLDVGLPRMDGYEVARKIRASHGIRRPLLIAITGYGAPEDRERAHDAGFDAHVTKPVDYGTLAALISAAEQPT